MCISRIERKTMPNTTIITAGGVGKRMGKDTYKQYLEIYGIPILALTTKKFQEHPQIDDIILVVPEDVVEMTREKIVKKYNLTKVSKVIKGGKERQFSVKNAIDALPEETEIVLIHDGVRPFITEEFISELLSEVNNKNAVIPALKPKETIKKINGEIVQGTINRNDYILVQTPQVFQRKILEEVYSNFDINKIQVTDDASLLENQGHNVNWIAGLEQNIKITTPADLELAEYYLKKYYKRD